MSQPDEVVAGHSRRRFKRCTSAGSRAARALKPNPVAPCRCFAATPRTPPLAYDIAQAMMDGFNRHYRLVSRPSLPRPSTASSTHDWHGQQRAQRERIEFYDLRVKECCSRLEREFKAGEQPMDIWQQVKLHYIGLLVNHHQPELAETFFNSVTTKILHRSYFQNDFIFVRPAVSTEYIENDEPHRR
jgi:isocitrate dehydrogenase kinase/phosphatase